MIYMIVDKMGKRKRFIEKKENRIPIFISLLVALIFFGVESIIWVVEYFTNMGLEALGYSSYTFVRGFSMIIAVFILGYLIIRFSDVLED